MPGDEQCLRGSPCGRELSDPDFAQGSLRRTSYARPGKLFTANEQLMVTQVGTLKREPFDKILDAVLKVLRP